MGNRAFIAINDSPEAGLYLQWNGGPESVYAFTDAALQLGCFALSGLVFLARAFFGLNQKHAYVEGYADPDTAANFADDNGLYLLPVNPQGEAWTADRWLVPAYGEPAAQMTPERAAEEAAEARATPHYAEMRAELVRLVGALEAARAA